MITPEELYKIMQEIGPERTAAAGFFHGLGGGSSGESNKPLMILAHVTQDIDFPPGTGIFEYKYPKKVAYPAFIQANILDPKIATSPTETGYEYEIKVLTSTIEGFAILFISKINGPPTGEEIAPFNQKVGIKVEHFEPTLTF